MRPAQKRGHAVAIAVLALLLGAAPARAQAGDRLDITATWSRNIQRLHAVSADTLGFNYEMAWSPEVRVDLRAIELPVGKAALKPALHLTAGFSADRMILPPAAPGQLAGKFGVYDFACGAALELPMETLLKGNAGVGLRLGWEGGYMMTRVGGQTFLVRSKLRMDFVRTGGALAGSAIGFGQGRDERFGYDAASNRWDVRLSLQGRVFSGPRAAVPAPPPVRPGAAAAPKPAAGADQRLLWVWADVDVDTDGGPGADGLRARAGVGLDLNVFVTALLTPIRK